MEGFCPVQKYSGLTSSRTGPKWLLRGRLSYLAFHLGNNGTIRTLLSDCHGHFTKGQTIKTYAGCTVAKIVA